MAMANITEELWDPALTLKEASKVGIGKDDYDSATEYARMVVEEHQRRGTPRESWEPTALHNVNLAEPFVTDGEQELRSRLEQEADPRLDESQALIENAREDLDKIVEHRAPLIGSETGASHSVAEAVERVEEYDTKIKRDQSAGQHHHHRASTLLQRLATWAPWIEAVGFLTFITYYLNVPLLEPWQDWLGWSFAATVVIAIILGQTWLVRHAARSHNHAREARADNHRHEADRAFTRRDWYLGLTAVTAVAITSGMIWRGIAALGNASIGTTVVLVFVAAVTGLLLPTLAFLGVALDGSRVSRERDGLASDLDDDLDEYLETIGDSRRDLARVAEIGDTLRDKTFPDICHTTQEVVDGVYGFYGTVRLLIGGLAADPPARTARTTEQDAAGSITGHIGTSIAGAGHVSLGPLFDRQHRLGEIETQRAMLLEQVDALSQHPWGNSRA
ncbi:MAG TPA: hypothetical protein VKU77_15035 [Streptosporangiaceae bacterium]|nr:hypothetical protein [Streptosporangiaceae bacterium]